MIALFCSHFLATAQTATLQKVMAPELRGIQQWETGFWKVGNDVWLYQYDHLFRFDTTNLRWINVSASAPVTGYAVNAASMGSKTLWSGDARNGKGMVTLATSNGIDYDTLPRRFSTFALGTEAGFFKSADSIFASRDLRNFRYIGMLRNVYGAMGTGDSVAVAHDGNGDSLYVLTPTRLLRKKFRLSYNRYALGYTYWLSHGRLMASTNYFSAPDTTYSLGLFNDSLNKTLAGGRIVEFKGRFYQMRRSADKVSEVRAYTDNGGRSWQIEATTPYTTSWQAGANYFGRQVGRYFYTLDDLRGIRRTADFTTWQRIDNNFYGRAVRFYNKKLWIQNEMGLPFYSTDTAATFQALPFNLAPNRIIETFVKGGFSRLGDQAGFFTSPLDTGDLVRYLLDGNTVVRLPDSSNFADYYHVGSKWTRFSYMTNRFQVSSNGTQYTDLPSPEINLQIANGDIYGYSFSSDSITYYNLQTGLVTKYKDTATANGGVTPFYNSSKQFVLTNAWGANPGFYRVGPNGLKQINSTGLKLQNSNMFFVSANEYLLHDSTGFHYTADTGNTWRLVLPQATIDAADMGRILDATVINNKVFINSVLGLYTTATLADVRQLLGTSRSSLLYPNPAGSYVRVKGARGTETVTIWNTAGDTISKTRLDAEGGLNVGSLRPGLYLIGVEGLPMQRMIKQ